MAKTISKTSWPGFHIHRTVSMSAAFSSGRHQPSAGEFCSDAVAETGCMWFNYHAIVETSNTLKEIDTEELH